MACKRVSLVLGSGGARGYAHIGVIKALEQANYQIHAIAGSSMGALVGGLYANGTLDDYTEWVQRLDFMAVMRLLDFSFVNAGMFKGDRIFERLHPFIGDRLIEDLPVHYTAVAVDLSNRKEFWFQRGSLRDAIRASIAVPMIFTPADINGRLFIDGGILNPLPLSVTVAHDIDIVIAVNVNAQTKKLPTTLDIASESDGAIQPRSLLGKALTFLKFQSALELRMLDVMNRSFEMMQESLSNYKIAGYPPDLEISIPVDLCNGYDFHKAQQVIDAGFAATEKALAEFESVD